MKVSSILVMLDPCPGDPCIMIARNYILDKPIRACQDRAMDEAFSLGVLDAKFTNQLEAAAYLESIRWPDGPVCPHCGESKRKPYPLKSATRRLYKCAACRKQYTVT